MLTPSSASRTERTGGTVQDTRAFTIDDVEIVDTFVKAVTAVFAASEGLTVSVSAHQQDGAVRMVGTSIS